MINPRILAVSRSGRHGFSKPNELSIRLLKGLGVDGDAHLGVAVQHRYAAARRPDAPNLRQVHLIPVELFDELSAAGFGLAPGDLGENVTTIGIDLLALPRGARLHLGANAIVEVTGLRTPCVQIERFRPGLLAAVRKKPDDRSDARGPAHRCGIMGIVVEEGETRAGDPITVEAPPGPGEPLGPV